MTETNQGQETTGTATKISFSVKTQIRSHVVAVEHVDLVEETHENVEEDASVTHFENGIVNGIVRKPKADAVIPRLPTANDWRINKLQTAIDDGTATDEQKALLELLLEAAGRKPIGSMASEKSEIMIEKDEEPDDVEPDYERVSVSEFGLAFLRGRGWKQEEGLGLTNKRVVPLNVQAKAKTFDLGIKKKKKIEGAPEIPLERGAAVLVLGGKHSGSYGRVLRVDTATSRCELKLFDDTLVTIVDKLLDTVSDKEYAEKGKIINKAAYDTVNEKHNGDVKESDSKTKSMNYREEKHRNSHGDGSDSRTREIKRDRHYDEDRRNREDRRSDRRESRDERKEHKREKHRHRDDRHDGRDSYKEDRRKRSRYD